MPTRAEVEEALRLDDLFSEEVDKLKDVVSSVIFVPLPASHLCADQQDLVVAKFVAVCSVVPVVAPLCRAIRS